MSFVLSHRFVLITSGFILKGTNGKSGHDVPFLTTQPGANREFTLRSFRYKRGGGGCFVLIGC